MAWYCQIRRGHLQIKLQLFDFAFSNTDLKIDWIWHLLINVLRILKPEISQFAWQTIQVIGPTLLYFSK